MSVFDVIAFDADDTLWHNERLYVDTQAKFAQLLALYHEPEWINARLYETEMRNLQHFGYGIKGFALSMIETAVELTEGRISGKDVQALIDLAKEMLDADVQLLDMVREVIIQLANNYRLMVITKGDLLDQETKIARSSLGAYFQQIEVVSQKSRERYERLLKKHAVEPSRFLMVGNSLRSDILPVLEIGGYAVHIPYEITWSHEDSNPPPTGQPGYYQLEHMGKLPALLAKLEQQGK
ncbi:MAG: HAD hydrolase-like protein [Anaerolineaceae bacterium]|nr:MAG: HAD hydrolase-like protein [Anaerolineaceae bacterium]